MMPAMRTVSRVALVAVTAMVLAACATTSGPASPSPTGQVSAPASPTATAAATEQLFPLGSHFTSEVYGYAIDLPDGWRPDPATQTWDGRYGSFGSDTPDSDRFHFQKGHTLWAVAAPTDATLEALLAGQEHSDATKHDCPRHPLRDDTQIGGEPALIELKHCPTESPTVVGTAATIHHGIGYFFYFIHPASIEASPDDRQVFQALLSTVTFR